MSTNTTQEVPSLIQLTPDTCYLVPNLAGVIAVITATGPVGWVMAGMMATVGTVVVAGDEELLDFSCWQHAIGSDAVASLDDDKVAFHKEHGMLLSQVLEHCEMLQAEDDGRLILKNEAGEL